MAVPLFINMSTSRPDFPEYHELVTDSFVQNNKVLNKRSRDDYEYCDEEERDLCPSVKKYISEEQMSYHLQSLQLATPPHNQSPPHVSTRDEPPTHWIDLLTSEKEQNNDSYQNNIKLFENQAYIDHTHLHYTANQTYSPYTDHSHPAYIDHTYLSPSSYAITDDESIDVTTPIEEDGDNDSSDNENSSSGVWIAPEVQSLLDDKKLLSTTILSEMNKPCTAVVLYREPESHLQETLWKKHILESLATASKEEEEKGVEREEEEKKDYLVKEPGDRSMLFSTQKSWASEDEMEL